MESAKRSVAKLQQSRELRKSPKSPTEGAAAESHIEPGDIAAPSVAKPTLRTTPRGDQQPDFLIPALYDVGTRDSRGIMDVAVFRLSKKDRRIAAKMRFELPDGFVEVSSGAEGMASVWDYDIVLMAISNLTESMNRHREGKGDKPGRVFRPHISDVLKFCRRDNGGKQKDNVIGALKRLSTTHVSMERTQKIRGDKTVTVSEGEALISRYKVITNTSTQRVEYVEIEVAEWMYREVVDGNKPDVLTVHPDYFLIDPGLARFVYRLARRAAGKTFAKWSFKLIYERSGSIGTFKEFCRLLRKTIGTNDLPEYSLQEVDGQTGPQLSMAYRGAIRPESIE